MRLEDGLSAPRASARVLKRALLDGRETTGVDIKAGVTVAEAVAARTPSLTDEERRSLRVVSYERDAEHVLDPEAWGRIRLKPGAFLVITDPPAGGVFRQILQIVVAIAAMAIAGPLGTALGGFFATTAGSGLLAAGIAMVGNLLVNALVPVRDSLGDEKASPLYTVEGFKNQLDIGGPIPLPVGLRHRYAPKYIVPPYIDVEDDKIFLTAVFACGYAPMELWDERIGDRRLDRFNSKTWQVERRGFMKDDGSVDVSPFTLVRETVVQRGQQISLRYREDGIDEEDEGPRAEPTVLETEPDTLRWKAILSCPQGLHRRSDKGKLGSYNVDIQIMIRPVTPGNNADWTFVETVSIIRKTLSPFYFEIEHEVPDGFRGAYELSFLRMSGEGTGGDEVADCDIIALQSILPEYPINQPIDCPFAMVCLRIQGTNQLKGTLDEYNALFASLIDAWNPSTQTYDQFKETGSPADWFRQLQTMPQNAKRIPVDHLYETEIRDWWQHCKDEELEFSRVYDYDISADAAIRDVCAVGRAVPRTSGGLRGVSADRRKDPLTAFPLTPHNTWGFEGKRSYKESDIHGWRIKFRDRINNFKTAIREVVRPDLPEGVEPTNFQELEPPGITHPKAAYIYGYKLWLEVIHRPDDYTSNLDIQSRMLQHGDLGAISHRSLHRAQLSGTVVAVHGSLVVLSEDVEMGEAHSYAVKFQRIEEVGGDEAAVKTVVWPVKTVAGVSRSVRLIGTGDMPAPGDIAWFGRESMEDRLAVIQNVEPNEDFNARITMIDQSNEIFDILDDLVVPPWSSRIGDVLPGDDRPPPRAVIKRVLSSASVYAEGEEVTKNPRRVVVYAAPGVGWPKAVVFQVRHRKASTPTWTYSEWTSFAGNALRIDGLYQKGDDIRLEVKGRTRLGVESEAWSDTKSHVVGQADEIGPVATDLSAFGYADGRISYSWLSPSETDKAKLYYGDVVEDVADMTPLHRGYVYASPFEITRPTAPGDYVFAVVLEAEDGTVGEPAYASFSIEAEAPPDPPVAGQTEALGGGVIEVRFRTSDSENVRRIRFYRAEGWQTFADATVLGTINANSPNVVYSILDEPPAGEWRWWAVESNGSGVESGPSAPTAVRQVGTAAYLTLGGDAPTLGGQSLTIG